MDFDMKPHSVEAVLNAATDVNLSGFKDWLEYVATTSEHAITPDEDKILGKLIMRDQRSGCLLYNLHPTPNVGHTHKSRPLLSARFIADWVKTWNSLVVSEGDSFSAQNLLYKRCCEFYFDFRVICWISVLSAYIALLTAIQIGIDAKNWSLYFGPLISDLVFIVAYNWGASIYKGGLKKRVLAGDESRVARERLKSAKDGVLASQEDTFNDSELLVGAKVYARYYEDGGWLPATIEKVHGQGDEYYDSGANEPTYDVMYDKNSDVEVAVKRRFVWLRPHGKASMYERFHNLRVETFDTLHELVFNTRPTRVKARTTNNSSMSEASPDYFEFTESGHHFHLRPSLSNSGGAGDERRSVNPARPSDATDSAPSAPIRSQQDLDSVTNDILNYYVKLQKPITCGYYGVLECVKKYMPTCSSSNSTYNGKYVQSRLNRLTTVFLVIMVIASPLINLGIWMLLFQQRNKSNFLERDCEDPECQANYFFFVATAGYVLSYIQEVMLYNAIFMVFVGLLYGCDSVHYLSKNWQLRYAGLRRISRVRRHSTKLTDDEDADDDSTESDGLLNKAHLLPLSDADREKHVELEQLFLLTPFIQRDAYERYLLIYHFVKEISAQWSSFLFMCIFLSLASTGITYYFVIKADHFVWQYWFALFVEALFIIYPLACLGYANKHVDNILRNFNATCPDDYEILGPREKWTEFTATSPLYWTILGVPVTKNVLTAYVSAAGTVAPVVLALVAGLFNAIDGVHK